MKYKVMGIIGLLLLVLGVALIILQLIEGEKTVVGSIAAGSSPIVTGSVLIGISRMLERKNASRAPSDSPK